MTTTDQQQAVSVAAAIGIMLTIGLLLILIAFIAWIYGKRNARLLYFANGIPLCPTFTPIVGALPAQTIATSSKGGFCPTSSLTYQVPC